jgi:hypothetical protein
VGDAAEHCKLGVLAEVEACAHPGEEVGEAVVPALDSLGEAGASARERQGSNAVRAEHDARLGVDQGSRRLEDVGCAFLCRAAHDGAVDQELEGRDLDTELKLLFHELADGARDFAGALEHDQPSGLGYAQVNGLPRSRVRRVCKGSQLWLPLLIGKVNTND